MIKKVLFVLGGILLGILLLSNAAYYTFFSIFQDIEYQSATLPIVVQLRVQAFDARQWNNRIYAYENDVLDAYSIPNVYGLGGRFWVNVRYKINDMFAIYLRVSESVYQQAWAAEHNRNNTRTDVHALVRIKL